jgi:hypothetical protein
VFGIQEAQIAGWADWSTVFAQYRIVRARLHLQATMLNCLNSSTALPANTFQTAVAFGINYSSATTAPTSIAQVQQLDNSHVLFPSGQGGNRSWELDLEKLFGIVWDDMGDNHVEATLQGYGTGFSASVTYPYVISGEVDVELRGLL